MFYNPKIHPAPRPTAADVRVAARTIAAQRARGCDDAEIARRLRVAETDDYRTHAVARLHVAMRALLDL